MLTHSNLAFVVASWLADLTPMDESDVVLHAAPLSHGAGFHALAGIARAARQVIPESTSFDPGSVLALIEREGVTNTWMVPTQIVMLADHIEASATGSVRLADSMRHIVYGGAPFAVADLRRALAVLGPRLVQLYAQGETPMTATMLGAREHAAALRTGDLDVLASAGAARPGMDVRVLDERDREVPAGDTGEVCVRGPAVMLGYWQRPEATESALRGGWLHTGDLGRMDASGRLFLLDRARDMIITGGSNVYPIEIENVLAAHDEVGEVAVVGVPDRRWGERVVAVVVPVSADADAAALTAALTAWCSRRVADYKRPRQYVVRASLPRNAYGKVLKRNLRDDLTAAMDAAGGGGDAAERFTGLPDSRSPARDA
jgi:long-chain acyl-CoA synthetase